MLSDNFIFVKILGLQFCQYFEYCGKISERFNSKDSIGKIQGVLLYYLYKLTGLWQSYRRTEPAQ